MNTDVDKIKIDFRNSATQVFFSIFSEFEKHSRKLDRQRDDNVFQQIQGRYARELEIQLTDLANKLMDQHKETISPLHLRRELTGVIDQYVREFFQKAKSR